MQTVRDAIPRHRNPDQPAGRRRSGRTGGHSQRRTVTRAELESWTNRLARAYANLGVHRGDYVTVALPNSIEWVAAVVATWKLGAIPQPLSARLPDVEYGHLLDLRGRALVVGGRTRAGSSRRCPPTSHRIRHSPTRHCQAVLYNAKVDGLRRRHRPAEADRGRRGPTVQQTRWRR